MQPRPRRQPTKPPVRRRLGACGGSRQGQHGRMSHTGPPSPRRTSKQEPSGLTWWRPRPPSTGGCRTSGRCPSRRSASSLERMLLRYRPRYRWCGGCIPGRCAAPRRAGNSSRRGEGAAGGAAEAIVKPCQRPPSLSRFPPCTRAAPTTRRSCFPSPFHSCRRCCHARPGTSATPQVRHPHSSRSG